MCRDSLFLDEMNAMKHILALSLLLLSVTGFSQNVYRISLKEVEAVPENVDFYIVEVYDGRLFTENIGIVNKGITNSKAMAVFELPLQQEILSYLQRVYPKKEGARPVSLRINDIFVSENREAKETGRAFVSLSTIEERNGEKEITSSFSFGADGTAFDVTKMHGARIAAALQACLREYATMPAERMTHYGFVAVAEHPATLPPTFTKGVYMTGTDVLNRMAVDFSNFEIRGGKDNKYYLYNNANNRVEPHYFAFSDGVNLYLNTAKYAEGSHYAKVDIFRHHYFVEKAEISVRKYQAEFAVLYGLAGAAIMAAVGPDEVLELPMLVDALTGKPVYLTREGMKTLLSAKDEIWKEYRKSDQGMEDKKAALRKFFTTP